MRGHTWAAAIVVALAWAGCDKKPPPSTPAAGSSASSIANAAETYQSVRAALGQPLLDAVKNQANADAMLAQHSAEIERLVEATRSNTCDFGVDRSQGWNTELPHLAIVRDLARVLRADGARLLAAGDADGAAKRTAAILRMAVHVSESGRAAIELLVAVGCAQLGAEFVTQNDGLARAAWKTDIQQALVSVEKGGTLSSGAFLARDGNSVARQLREGKIPDLSSAGGHNWAAASQTERDGAARKLDALVAEVLTAWNSGGAVARLSALGERARNEGVSDLFTQWDKARASVDKLNQAIVRANAILR